MPRGSGLARCNRMARQSRCGFPHRRDSVLGPWTLGMRPDQHATARRELSRSESFPVSSFVPASRAAFAGRPLAVLVSHMPYLRSQSRPSVCVVLRPFPSMQSRRAHVQHRAPSEWLVCAGARSEAVVAAHARSGVGHADAARARTTIAPEGAEHD